jgi:hypothetical protein
LLKSGKIFSVALTFIAKPSSASLRKRDPHRKTTSRCQLKRKGDLGNMSSPKSLHLGFCRLDMVLRIAGIRNKGVRLQKTAKGLLPVRGYALLAA